MELLIPHTCKVCGLTDEAQIRYAGPHLKMSCNHCGTYHKFFSKHLMPDYQEIKLKIWAITQDTCEIDAAKEWIDFVENLTGLDRKIMYWRLYLYLRNDNCGFAPDMWVFTDEGQQVVIKYCSFTGYSIVFSTDRSDVLFIIENSGLSYKNPIKEGIVV